MRFAFGDWGLDKIPVSVHIAENIEGRKLSENSGGTEIGKKRLHFSKVGLFESSKVRMGLK